MRDGFPLDHWDSQIGAIDLNIRGWCLLEERMRLFGLKGNNSEV